jgi:hypothetical protein
MSIVLVGSTSGSITLQEPAIAGTTVLDLPAISGTVVVSGTTPTLNGITFPATQVPSADANTLDDYEEGTWTPTFVASGATFTYDAQAGRYTKIGNIVHAACYIGTDISGGAGSVVKLTGLPFTVASIANYYPAASLGQIWQLDYPVGAIQVIAFSDPNTTNIIMQFCQDNNINVSVVGANIRSSPTRTYIMFNITYQV